MGNFKKVILVNENDIETGFDDKLNAHFCGKLHRAFSIFVFNDKNEILIQQRAVKKYHSGGLWTNTCCSHPQPESTIEKDISDRLFFEMGIKCNVNKIFSFKYKVVFENGITENEYDHVYIGFYNADPKPNKNEVENWKWISIPELQYNMLKNPENYTEWFKIALPKLIKKLQVVNIRQNSFGD